MKNADYAAKAEKLHKTFNTIIRSKNPATSPSTHEKDFGAYVAMACDTTDSDWKRVDRMDGFIKPAGDDVPSYVKHWVFPEENLDILRLAGAAATVAEGNDIGANEFRTMFTMMSRMLKIEGSWAI